MSSTTSQIALFQISGDITQQISSFAAVRDDSVVTCVKYFNAQDTRVKRSDSIFAYRTALPRKSSISFKMPSTIACTIISPFLRVASVASPKTPLAE